MEPIITSSKRGRRSRRAVADNVRLRKEQELLRKLCPEAFDYDKSSPSAVLQHSSFQMAKGFEFGLIHASIRQMRKRAADRRFQESRMRSYGHLYRSPFRHMQDKMFRAEQKHHRSISYAWKDRVEFKRWQIEDAFYADEASQVLHAL